MTLCVVITSTPDWIQYVMFGLASVLVLPAAFKRIMAIASSNHSSHFFGPDKLFLRPSRETEYVEQNEDLKAIYWDWKLAVALILVATFVVMRYAEPFCTQN